MLPSTQGGSLSGGPWALPAALASLVSARPYLRGSVDTGEASRQYQAFPGRPLTLSGP